MTTYCKNIDIFWPKTSEEEYDLSFDPDELDVII
jgi:hypothetical protein